MWCIIKYIRRKHIGTRLLFSIQEDTRPLADRMRPETLDEYVGQKQLVAKGNLLWQMIEHDQVTSMIFWGPPGVGKTTLARIIAHRTKKTYLWISQLLLVALKKSRKL